MIKLHHFTASSSLERNLTAAVGATLAADQSLQQRMGCSQFSHTCGLLTITASLSDIYIFFQIISRCPFSSKCLLFLLHSNSCFTAKSLNKRKKSKALITSSTHSLNGELLCHVHPSSKQKMLTGIYAGFGDPAQAAQLLVVPESNGSTLIRKNMKDMQ